MKKIIALAVVLLIIELEGLMSMPLQIPDSASVKKGQGKNSVEYKVREHDGWYAIARRYDVSYQDLRAANKELGDTLHIGQVIQIPAARVRPLEKEVLFDSQPVYHTVKEKETLFSIAKKNKVRTADLKKWNHLETTGVKKGENLIVGFRKSNKEEVIKSEKNMPETPVKEVKVQAPDSTLNVTVSEGGNTVHDSAAAPKAGLAHGRKQVMEQGIATWIEDENINPNKYFALHRTAAAGSIIKVTNKMNKRSVFVKVVGKLPDTGDNENMIIKISKASAEKLGVRDQRFQCELSYGITEK